jgi:cobalt-zinc-cadmium efflux system membrane fusion protein
MQPTEEPPTPVSPPVPAAKHSKTSTAVVIVALAVLAGGAVVMSGVRLPWQSDAQEKTVTAPAPLDIELVKEKGVPEHSIRIPEDVRRSLGIIPKGKVEDEVAEAKPPKKGQQLVLPGSTLLDPTRVTRIRIRFTPADVMAIGETENYRSAFGQAEKRPFRSGDVLKKTETSWYRPSCRVPLLELYSIDVGNKKNDLFEAIIQLRQDQIILKNYESGKEVVPAVLLLTARRNVATDESAVTRARNVLRTWNISLQDIKSVEDEAYAVDLSGPGLLKARTSDMEERLERWGHVVITTPPIKNGEELVIVERNVADKEVLVDLTVNLFVLARVDRMMVAVNAPEELLPTLEGLQGAKRRWTISTAGAAGGESIKDQPIDDISYLVDPNQHSLVIKGYIDNPRSRNGTYLLRGGQYVTATIQLDPPEDVVEVPVHAVVEDGKQSIVFVQHPERPDVYTMRRVQVTHRFESKLWVRSKPFQPGEEITEEEKNAGLLPRQALALNEKVLVSGLLELKKELEDRESGAADKR